MACSRQTVPSTDADNKILFSGWHSKRVTGPLWARNFWTQSPFLRPQILTMPLSYPATACFPTTDKQSACQLWAGICHYVALSPGQWKARLNGNTQHMHEEQKGFDTHKPHEVDCAFYSLGEMVKWLALGQIGNPTPRIQNPKTFENFPYFHTGIGCAPD